MNTEELKTNKDNLKTVEQEKKDVLKESYEMYPNEDLSAGGRAGVDAYRTLEFIRNTLSNSNAESEIKEMIEADLQHLDDYLKIMTDLLADKKLETKNLKDIALKSIE